MMRASNQASHALLLSGCRVPVCAPVQQRRVMPFA